ncbi:hypothetical protein SEVIR_5G388250v4 [Setaria viridis]
MFGVFTTLLRLPLTLINAGATSNENSVKIQNLVQASHVYIFCPFFHPNLGFVNFISRNWDQVTSSVTSNSIKMMILKISIAIKKVWLQ